MSAFGINLNYWILQSIAMGVTALLIPKLRITSIFGAILMVVGLALVNSHLWDAALFFQVPDSISMQTGMLLAANGMIFWGLVKLLPGIEIQGILPALIAPIVFTVLSVLLYHYSASVDFIELGKRAGSALTNVREYFGQSGAASASVSSK